MSARRLVRLAPAMLALGLVAFPAAATAASPVPPPLPPNVEAWLDAPYEVPGDLPVGGRVEVGLTFWDTAARGLADVTGVYARLHPATGHAKPTAADGVMDWPGHLLFDLAAPKGGPGRVEFRVRPQACAPPDDCTGVPLKLAGTGPPPDAPPAALVAAEPLPMVGDVVVGRAASLAVLLTPKGGWDADALALPDRIVAVATDGLGADLGSAELLLSGRPGTPYTGRLTIAKAGGATIGFAIAGQNGEPDQFMEGAARVQVVEPGLRLDGATAEAERSPAPGAVTPAAEDGSSAVWILLLGLLVVAAVLIFGGTVRGWLRRGES